MNKKVLKIKMFNSIFSIEIKNMKTIKTSKIKKGKNNVFYI